MIEQVIIGVLVALGVFTGLAVLAPQRSATNTAQAMSALVSALTLGVAAALAVGG